jgi:hypothetical protein
VHKTVGRVATEERHAQLRLELPDADGYILLHGVQFRFCPIHAA